jgi:hypothetical protein
MPTALSRPSAATLLIEAELQPNTTYTLAVAGSPSIRDGFGLPLLPSHSTFTTAEVTPKLLLPGETKPYGYAYGALRPIRFATAPAGAGGGQALSPPATWPGLVYGSAGVCRSQGTRSPPCTPDRAVNATLVPVPPGRYREVLAALSPQPRDVWPKLMEGVVPTGGAGDTAGGLSGWPRASGAFAEVRQVPLAGALNQGGTSTMLVRLYHTDEGERARTNHLQLPVLVHSRLPPPAPFPPPRLFPHSTTVREGTRRRTADTMPLVSSGPFVIPRSCPCPFVLPLA